MIALKCTMFAAKKGDDAMWKELFINLMADTLPASVTIPKDVSKIMRSFAFVSSTVEELTLDIETTGTTNNDWRNSINSNNIIYSSPNIRILRMPNAHVIGYPSVVNSVNSMTDIYLPSIDAFGDAGITFYNYNGTRLNVHCEPKTCEQIRQITNFPGTNNETIRQKLTFIGSDGQLNWNGSEWVKS